MEMSNGVFVSNVATQDYEADPDVPGTEVHTLFDTGKLRITRGVSRELMQMADYAPIRGLHE